MRIHLILNVALLAFSLGCAEAQESGRGTGLPKEVVPHAYKISLVPDLARLSDATGRETVGFTGHVQIQFEVLQPAETITLNAHEISVVRAERRTDPITERVARRIIEVTRNGEPDPRRA